MNKEEAITLSKSNWWKDKPVCEMRSTINPMQRNINFYLEKIGIENFMELKVFSTAGDIRPPYPYQWQALSIPFGDDSYEGIGATPFEAIKNLYKEIEGDKDEK